MLTYVFYLIQRELGDRRNDLSSRRPLMENKQPGFSSLENRASDDNFTNAEDETDMDHDDASGGARCVRETQPELATFVSLFVCVIIAF